MRLTGIRWLAGLVALAASCYDADAASVKAFVEVQAVTGANPPPEADLHYSTDSGTMTNSSGPPGQATTTIGPSTASGLFYVFTSAGIPRGTGSAGIYQANSQATANLYTGKIHVGTTGVNAGSGQANGELHDQVTFHNTSNATQQITIIWRIDGQLSIDPNAGSALAGANGSFGFQLISGPQTDNSYLGNTIDFSASLSQSGSNPQQSQNSMSANPNNSPVTITPPPNGYGGTATMTIHLDPGQAVFKLDEVLSVNASNSSADFTNTAALTFILPASVTFNSESGVLLSTGFPRLANIATRERVLTNDNAAIVGFIVSGTEPKTVIIRGMGPSLPVPGPLPDPTLELHQGNTVLATNDNWKFNDQTQSSQETAVRATTVPPGNDLESAMIATLSPGAYTAVLRGKGSATGIGSVEVYDLSSSANGKLANISTRGFVDTDDNAMIGGIIVVADSTGSSGSTSKVVFRAIGPSLTNFGITGTLQDPTLDVRDGNGNALAFNDDWQGDPNAAELQLLQLAPTDSRESATVQVLSPGNYTVIVRGKNGTGVGLVEAFNVQ